MNKKIIPIIFFFSIIFVSLMPIWQKINIENINRKVEIVFPYNSVEQLFLLTGKPIKFIFKDLSEAGVTSILLQEETIDSLMNKGKVSIIKGSEILNFNRVFKSHRNIIFSRIPRNHRIQPEYTYLVIDENNLFEFVKRNLQIKLGHNRVIDLGWNIIEIIDLEDNILEIPLDINFSKINQITKYGFSIIPLFINSPFFNEETVNFKISQINRNNLHTVLFEEGQLLGYPDYTEIFYFKLREYKKMLGFIEFNKLAGLNLLSTRISDKLLKVHYLDIDEVDANRFIKRAVRSVIERNCRILLVTPFIDNKSNDLYQFNINIIKDIKEQLKKQNYKIGVIKDSVYEKFISYNVFQYLIYICVLICVVFLLYLLTGLNFKSMNFLIIGFVIFGVVFLMVNKSLFNELMALITAISIPAIIFITLGKLLSYINGKFLKFLWLKYVVVPVYIFFGSLVGAIIINNLLYDPIYFLAINGFRGVKIANLAPFLIIALYYYVKPNRMKYIVYVAKRYVDRHLTVRYLLVILLILLFFIIYILRTGNYGMLVLGEYEIMFRQLLEDIFMARPRTKEILIGYPLLIVALYYWSNKGMPSLIKYGLLLFSSITSISIINTFCHLHCPVYISLLRSLYGLILGVCFGFIAIGLLKIGELLFVRYLKHE